MVSYLKEKRRCIVEVIAFGETASGKLKEASDEFVDLSQNKAKYLLKIRSRTEKEDSVHI